MGDGAGEMADADALVEGDGAEPHRPLLLALVQHLPEADVMAAVGALARGLFEREVFAAAEIEQRAHGRVGIGAVEQHAARNFNRRSERHGIGGKPFGRVHRAQDFLFVADQAGIDRVARNVLRGACHHRQRCQPLLVLVVRPERRQHEIGEHGVNERDREHGEQHALQLRVLAGRGMRIGGMVGHGANLARRTRLGRLRLRGRSATASSRGSRRLRLLPPSRTSACPWKSSS